jgi:hypothetical protein
MNFLYWNIRGNKIASVLSHICKENDIDLLLLSECPYSIGSLLESLNETLDQKFGYAASRAPADDPVVLIRFEQSMIESLADYAGITIRRIFPRNGPDFILSVVHLPSRRYHSPSEQTLISTSVVRFIEDAERYCGHKRSLLVGDFNMNPFDDGMVGAQGFHAISHREIARKGSRVVDGVERTFFYNPMWNHLGDSNRIGGTYYYDKSTQIRYYWNIFDQVLIRPDLLSFLDETGPKIVAEYSNGSLLNEVGTPDQNIGSDHLPILFSLNQF